MNQKLQILQENEVKLEQLCQSLSIFSTDWNYEHTIEQVELLPEYKHEKYIQAKFNIGVYSCIDSRIIRFLKIFHYLNRNMLERCIKYSLKAEDINISKNLKLLYEDGLIRKHKFTRKETDEELKEKSFGNWQVLTAYELTKEGYHYAAIYNIGYKTYNYHEPKDIKALPSIILETLSIAQWHISLVTNYRYCKGKYMIKTSYGESVVKIPSLCEIGANKNTVISALPIPKNLKDESILKKTFGKLLKIKGFLADNKVKKPMIVFISDTISKAEQMADTMRQFEKIANIPFLFCLDSNTTEGNYSLDNIYHGVYKDNKFKLMKVKIENVV